MEEPEIGGWDLANILKTFGLENRWKTVAELLMVIFTYRSTCYLFLVQYLKEKTYQRRQIAHLSF
jgi:hypothetical protein